MKNQELRSKKFARSLKIDLDKLENVHPNGDRHKAQCPACAEEGGDDSGNHLIVYEDGRFGCVMFQGDEGKEHRRRILELAGLDVPVAGVATAKKVKKTPAKTYPTAKWAANLCTPPAGNLVDLYHYPKGGKQHAAVARYETPEGKTFRQFHFSEEDDGWQAGGPDGQWALYERGLAPTGAVYVVEGEKCQQAACSIGLSAVNSAGGAKAAAKTDWSPLAGREVVILPDNDEPGRQYAEKVAAILSTLTPPATVKIVNLPEASADGDDIADVVEACPDPDRPALKDRIEQLAAEAAAYALPKAALPNQTGEQPFVKSESGTVSVNQVAHARIWATETGSRWDDVGGCFTRHDPKTGIWRSIGRRQCIAEIGEQYAILCSEHECPGMLSRRTQNLLDDIFELAKSFAPAYCPEKTPEGFIPVADGVIDITSGIPTLKPHSETYGFRYQAPVSWGAPSVQCPRFLAALNEALPPEDISLIQRYAGQCLLGKNLSQTILILRGTPAGGKSTLVNILSGLIGAEFVTEMRTAHLSDRFELSRLVGRTLLLGVDVPSNFLDSLGASRLKPLVGGDIITIERKNSNEAPSVRGEFNLLITTNTRLRVRLDGDTGAWRRRLLIVDYERKPPAQPIPDFAGLLLREEGAGILRWAVEGAIALRAELSKGKLQLTDAQRQRTEDLLTESDSVTAFVKEYIVPATTGDITTYEASTAYNDFCDEKGWAAEPERNFASRFVLAMRDIHGVARRNDIRRGADLHRGYSRVKIVRIKPLSPRGPDGPALATKGDPVRTLRTPDTNSIQISTGVLTKEESSGKSNKDFAESVRSVRDAEVTVAVEPEPVFEAIPPDCVSVDTTL